jgi:outer membrane protein TolC
LQKELANAKQQENDTNSRVKAGIGDDADFLVAQACRLEVEFKLAQESAK